MLRRIAPIALGVCCFLIGSAGAAVAAVPPTTPPPSEPLPPTADLAMGLSGQIARTGQTVTVTLGVLNTGPSTVTPTSTVTVAFQNGLEPLGVAGDGWSCTLGQTVVCSTAATPAPGSFLPLLNISVRVNASASLTASVSNANDPNPANDSNVQSITINDAPVDTCPDCPLIPTGPLPETGSDADLALIATLSISTGAVLLVMARLRRRPS